jgi:hypothetical protein
VLAFWSCILVPVLEKIKLICNELRMLCSY